MQRLFYINYLRSNHRVSLFYINYELTTSVREKASVQHVKRMSKIQGTIPAVNGTVFLSKKEKRNKSGCHLNGLKESFFGCLFVCCPDLYFPPELQWYICQHIYSSK